jgi:pSer/pThr/pTyr-binding forkhead associated (FHA) protein
MNLNDLESRLQTLIEVQLLSVLPGQKVEDLVIQKLAAAMHANLVTLDDGSLMAPNVYTIIVNPRSDDKWREPKLLKALIEVLNQAGEEAGFKFATPPTITISTDKSLSTHEANVMASQRVEPMAETKGTANENEIPQGSEHIPENAFLIIEGVKVFPLKLSVVNIGRRLDNQLVIDDPRVSRNHSQLRAINGRFVLFDLNSTGGTFVNGQRANQTVLYPGDVISLAGVALIFGQDNPPPRPDLIETSPLQTSTGERPTAILKDRSTAKMKKK